MGMGRVGVLALMPPFLKVVGPGDWVTRRCPPLLLFPLL